MRIPVQLADGECVSLPLRLFSGQATVRPLPDGWQFDVPDAKHAYLCTSDAKRFDQPPSADPLRLEPLAPYRLTVPPGSCEGDIRLWVLEYDERERLERHVTALSADGAELRWVTGSRYHRCAVALRLAGSGVIRRGRWRLWRGLTLRSGHHRLLERELRSGEACLTSLQQATTIDAWALAGPDEPSAAHAGSDPSDAGGAPVASGGPYALLLPERPNTLPGLSVRVLTLARRHPGRVFPICDASVENASARPADDDFRVRQYELLWQSGMLYGLMFRDPHRPPRAALRWACRRGVLSLWMLRDGSALAAVRQVLRNCALPALLYCEHDTAPLCDSQLGTVIGESSSVFLVVTDALLERPGVQQLVRRFPHRTLYGSGLPFGTVTAAQREADRLNLPETQRRQVLCGNLHTLLAGVIRTRQQAMRAHDLLFPPLPRTPEDTDLLGFVIVPPEQFDAREDSSAKQFWAAYPAKQWYREPKPWARYIAGLVAELRPRSVLEFGCNVGRNLACIAETVPGVKLTGIDINPQAIELGRRHSDLDLRVGDETALRELPDGAFDLVFTVSVLDHIADLEGVCRELLRVAGRWLLCLEVTLPREGRVVRHDDHSAGCVRDSTGASYSWDLRRVLSGQPRVRRLDSGPCYLHSAALGPYYHVYLAALAPHHGHSPVAARAGT